VPLHAVGWGDSRTAGGLKQREGWLMIQAADGDVPWEINPPAHSQRAPEILIMLGEKKKKKKKCEERRLVNNS